MKKIRWIAAFLVMALLLSACSGSQAKEITASIKPMEVSPVAPGEEFYEKQLGFSLALFQKAAEAKEENVLVSPLSVSTALAMAANGADGQTAKELEAVLGYSAEDLNRYLYSFKESLRSNGAVKFQEANSIWLRDLAALQVNEEFLQKIKSYYEGQVFQASFNQATLKEINQWVDTHTNGMIPELFSSLSPEALVILINAIAFDAAWRDPYKDVRDQGFFPLDGERQDAKLMYSTEGTYLENEKFQGFLRLYNNQYSFGALLPKEREDFSKSVQSLGAEEFSALLANASAEPVKAALPKFKTEYSIELNEILQEMGVLSAFDINQADFSKLSAEPLALDVVIHRAAIEVDEEGTKAAAATGIGMNGGSAMPSEIKQVILNRPFIYFILDHQTNLPIFIGTVTSL